MGATLGVLLQQMQPGYWSTHPRPAMCTLTPLQPHLLTVAKQGFFAIQESSRHTLSDIPAQQGQDKILSNFAGWAYQVLQITTGYKVQQNLDEQSKNYQTLRVKCGDISKTAQ